MDDPPRGRRAYRSLFWPVVLVAAGVVGLLVDAGVLGEENLTVLAKVWPVFLIVIGLDLVFGRRSAVLGAVLALGGVAVIVGLMLIGPSRGWSESTELTRQRLSESVGSATSARLELDLAEPSVDLAVRPGDPALIQADMLHRGSAELLVSGDGEKVVRLRYDGRSGFFDWVTGDRPHWTIGLSDAVPLALAIDGGSGSSSLDLGGLILRELSLDVGSGSSDLLLPVGSYDTNLVGGSGSLSVAVPRGARTQMDLDVGSGSVDLTVAAASDVELTLRGGSGSFGLDTPAQTALRVVVTDSGSGSVSVPSTLEQIERGEGDEGIWESPGFGDAQHRILVRVEDMSSGSVSVR